MKLEDPDIYYTDCPTRKIRAKDCMHRDLELEASILKRSRAEEVACIAAVTAMGLITLGIALMLKYLP